VATRFKEVRYNLAILIQQIDISINGLLTKHQLTPQAATPTY